jgi:hypothetical protein
VGATVGLLEVGFLVGKTVGIWVGKWVGFEPKQQSAVQQTEPNPGIYVPHLVTQDDLSAAPDTQYELYEGFPW